MTTTHHPLRFSPVLTASFLRTTGGGAGRPDGGGRGERSRALWRLEGAPHRAGLSWAVFVAGVVLILTALAGGVLYIREITSTTASGYDVSALERRAEDLRQEEQRLQLEAAELESLKRVEERVPKLDLVPVQALAFTTPEVDTTLAGQIPVGTARR